ncbi:alpha/beta hydrolase [Polaribacter sp. Q13]|uniref:alpha/beta hydrolase n=1 Tax=Polaribacter sp. Q13 TaxID=2806551 RepID=UPI00193C80B1|nr:alpha/beta hydrolase [Polaribacter sp. Q13]QVY63996.1 alpha/beta hydrolase [Polaribacter sp. Q13]
MYVLLILGCLFVFVAIVIFSFQEKFIFLNGDQLDQNYPFKFTNKFKEIFIKTDKDTQINALHFQLPNPKGVVLFCHGNKGNLTKWGDRVAYFLDYNYEVLVYDYRNYGKSIGRYNETAMYNDGLSVYTHLKELFKEDEIVIYGFSIGGTFATKIASLNKPKELILEAPFYNFKKAAQYKSIFAPTFLLKYQFRSDKDISKVTCPITIFHGNKDSTTSYIQSRRLLELNASTQNKYIEIDGGTHHNLREFTIYKENLKEILER